MVSARQKAIDATLAREDYVWEQGREKGEIIGRRKGEIAGREKGRMEERKVLVKTLFSKGKSAKEIADLVGMKVANIEEIVKLYEILK